MFMNFLVPSQTPLWPSPQDRLSHNMALLCQVSEQLHRGSGNLPARFPPLIEDFPPPRLSRELAKNQDYEWLEHIEGILWRVLTTCLEKCSRACMASCQNNDRATVGQSGPNTWQ
eukprot:Gb_40479 [translate_table: standard]